MRRRLQYLAAAQEDIFAIFDYIAGESGSLVTGRSFVGRLRRRCTELSGLPGQMGRPRPEFGADIRSTAFGNYVIIFRYARNDLEIVQIIEGHRDIEARFLDSGE
jgi:plasmid stabilization system protein ParE